MEVSIRKTLQRAQLLEKEMTPITRAGVSPISLLTYFSPVKVGPNCFTCFYFYIFIYSKEHICINEVTLSLYISFEYNNNYLYNK